MVTLFEIDELVGSLVGIIGERGLAEETIITVLYDNGGVRTSVSSQHGHNSHGPFRDANGDVYESGNRVLMILR